MNQRRSDEMLNQCWDFSMKEKINAKCNQREKATVSIIENIDWKRLYHHEGTLSPSRTCNFYFRNP